MEGLYFILLPVLGLLFIWVSSLKSDIYDLEIDIGSLKREVEELEMRIERLK